MKYQVITNFIAVILIYPRLKITATGIPTFLSIHIVTMHKPHAPKVHITINMLEFCPAQKFFD
jgi:hypothetical protein